MFVPLLMYIFFIPSCTLLLLKFFTHDGLLCLERDVKAWIRANTPSNTTRAYSTYSRQYTEFARSKGLNPAESVTLCAFMKDAVERPRPLSRSTIVKVIPSAVADMYRYDEHSPTDSELVRQAKKVAKRLTAPSVPRKPVSKAQLLEMVVLATANPSEMEVRDMFMLVLMFLGFLRESEVVRLRVQDVWLDKLGERDVLMVFVGPWAKADTERRGETIVLASQPSSWLCPVQWYKLHSAFRKPTKWSSHVFHSVTGNLKPLADKTPYHTVKRLLVRIGVDPTGYGSHSMRRGGATAAAKFVRTHVLKRHGRWKSDAVYLYVDDDAETVLSVTDAILKP